MNLIQGDCLEKMKDISDNSIDLLFCDLPYGQTSCKWDNIIDLDIFWEQVNRICKLDCPMFFTCSTKFGVSLINSNPKNFRYDLVWVKSSPCGFLNAKKMPMKKHEMVYVFYRKLPMYDLSSHQHKFLRERKEEWCDKNGLYGEDTSVPKIEYKYDPPLPNSVINSQISREMKAGVNNLYGDMKGGTIGNIHGTNYDPPLPNSVIKQERNTPKLEECFGKEYLKNKPNYRNINPNLGANGTDCHIYDPPLPNTILDLKEQENPRKEKDTKEYKNDSKIYGKIDTHDFIMRKNGESRYDPPLPVSVIKTELYSDENKEEPRELYRNEGGQYDPPLPHSLLEIKSEKGKHATQKPTELIKWCLKYYSKEGDTVLDPTMGSGSTGVACKEMNRNFIGIELDKKIYSVAEKRITKLEK
jgi:DNA modification methylase